MLSRLIIKLTVTLSGSADSQTTSLRSAALAVSAQIDTTKDLISILA